jgi:hypothetical protein
VRSTPEWQYYHRIVTRKESLDERAAKDFEAWKARGRMYEHLDIDKIHDTG